MLYGIELESLSTILNDVQEDMEQTEKLIELIYGENPIKIK